MRPKRPTVYDLNLLGVEFYRAQAYELAIIQLEQAARMAPEAASIHLNLGGAYYGKERLDEAEREFRTALALDPNHVRAHWFRGRCLERLGRLTEALAEFHWVCNHSTGTWEARASREGIEIIDRMRGAHDGGPARPEAA
jgi:tetratricopeptide (TPR) repeat protein